MGLRDDRAALLNLPEDQRVCTAARPGPFALPDRCFGDIIVSLYWDHPDAAPSQEHDGQLLCPYCGMIFSRDSDSAVDLTFARVSPDDDIVDMPDYDTDANR